MALFQKGGQSRKRTRPSKQRGTLLSSKQPANHSVTDRSQGIIALMAGHCDRCGESQPDERYTGRSMQLSFLLLLCSTGLVRNCTSQTIGASVGRSEDVSKAVQKAEFLSKFLFDRNDFRAYRFLQLNVGSNTGFRERTESGNTRPIQKSKAIALLFLWLRVVKA